MSNPSPPEDAWLAELADIRAADAAAQENQAQQAAAVDARAQANEILVHSQAHRLLRQVQKVLLNGGGSLKAYERSSQYTMALALMWQGPVSNPSLPVRRDVPTYYLIIGVKSGVLWVNDRTLPDAEPATLKQALVAAARQPGEYVPQDSVARVRQTGDGES